MKELLINYWVEIFFSCVTAVLGYSVRVLNKKINEQEAIKMGVQALLRDRIIQSYNYHMDLGFCPVYARESIEEMAEQYYNLGGNGVVHQLMDKLSELPTNKPKEVSTVERI